MNRLVLDVLLANLRNFPAVVVCGGLTRNRLVHEVVGVATGVLSIVLGTRVVFHSLLIAYGLLHDTASRRRLSLLIPQVDLATILVA